MLAAGRVRAPDSVLAVVLGAFMASIALLAEGTEGAVRPLGYALLLASALTVAARRRAPRTVAAAKTHVSRAMTKLGARDRAQLVVFAFESGLVVFPPGAQQP